MQKNDFQTQASLSSIFFRGLGGFFSGLSGAVVLGLVLFVSWPIVEDTFVVTQTNQMGAVDPQPHMHPLFMSVVLMGVFLSSLIANIVYSMVNSMMLERYSFRSTILTHVFFGNLVILLLFVPVYLSASSYGPLAIEIIALSHATITALFTFFVLEILSTSPYIFVSLYGGILGLILFLFFGVTMIDGNAAIVSFLALPFLLLSLNVGSTITEMFYAWFNQTYGVDFLDTKKRYGQDYGRPEKPDQNDDNWDEL
jgi:hypothetical protein